MRPGATATEADLQDHARATIDERPAWPRRIHILDVIPMTAVGKIYKPALRCDAARRTVEQMLVDPLDVPGAAVTALEGGKRGMKIAVTLPASAAGARAKVTAALSAYLFDVSVEVANAQ